MKRFFILLGIVFLFVTSPIFADQKVLIDFSKLTEDTQDGQNARTVIDFKDIPAAMSFDAEAQDAMSTSLELTKWNVDLSKSSVTAATIRNSYTASVKVKDGEKRKYAGQNVLGIRVLFPEGNFNSFARVSPPFEIPAYMNAEEGITDDNGEAIKKGQKYEGYGVLSNVGVIKQISVNVYGRNFPQGLSIIVQKGDNEEQVIFMNYLNFNGWRQLTWENPNYQKDVRDRVLRKKPSYPNSEAFFKLKGFLISKDAMMNGGDYVGYIKDVILTFDKDSNDLDSDIDDEDIWQIMTEREDARIKFEREKLGDKQVLHYLEKLKMHKDQASDVETDVPAN